VAGERKQKNKQEKKAEVQDSKGSGIKNPREGRMIAGWFDGACGPENPGGTASYGALVRIDGVKVWECSEIMGGADCQFGTTNNLAEYAGLAAVLKWLLDAGHRLEPVVVRGDSKLVIQQMNGLWRIRRGSYVALAFRCQHLLFNFPQLQLAWIPRRQNQAADKLSKRCLPSVADRLDIAHLSGLREQGLLL
jgi:ribonuclease HI